MIELQLAQCRRARVWLNHLPDARLRSANFIEKSFPSGRAMSQTLHRAAIEILIPRGPRALYGLLGGEWFPDASGQLQIRVSACAVDRKRFLDSIALDPDEARVGLPVEFAEAVLKGASEQIEELSDKGAGQIIFDHAAHGLVGSAPIIFDWLAARIVQVLQAGDSVDREQLAQILQLPL